MQPEVQTLTVSCPVCGTELEIRTLIKATDKRTATFIVDTRELHSHAATHNAEVTGVLAQDNGIATGGLVVVEGPVERPSNSRVIPGGDDE